VNGRLVPRADLGVETVSSMLELLQRHFDGVTPGQFAADLAAKDWVVLVEDDAGAVQGFSTLAVYDSAVAPVRVVCSGDTIVASTARGSTALGRAWLGAIRQTRPDYWLLLTSGLATYRFLPVFWREFWPRHDSQERPPLLDELAAERFGAGYDATTGTVRFDTPQRLRGDAGPGPSGRRADPHAEFFARANPGHAQGDELVCLCPLSPGNQTAAGKRLLTL
jgi:hypothetical protein